MGIKKEFRLKSKKSIGTLLKSRNRLKAYPLHLMYNTGAESDFIRKRKVQVAFSAPKRIHRSAVQRNLYKRRMREAFRPFIPGLEAFMEKNEYSLDLMLIYVGSEPVGHIDVKVKIKVLLDRLEKQLNRGNTDEENQNSTPRS